MNDTHTTPSITLYHNPLCSVSRHVLQAIQQQGITPHIIEYLKTPLSKTALLQLIQRIDVPIRDILRTKEAIYTSLNLAESHWTDDQLVDHIIAHPILMNRPIVETSEGAWLCRPAEKIVAILAELND